MITTVVAILCQTLGAAGMSGPEQMRVCHEEIVVQGDMPMQACILFPPALAEWKLHSRFKSRDWEIEKVRCLPGDYKRRDAI